MDFGINEFTLLDEEQVFSDNDKIDLIRDIGAECALTDFAITFGVYVAHEFHVDYDNSLKGRTGWYLLSTSCGLGDIRAVTNCGFGGRVYAAARDFGIRPVLKLSEISEIYQYEVTQSNGVLEVEYGEYPQYAVSKSLESELEQAYLSGTIRKTGKTYRTDSIAKEYDVPFKVWEHEEYEYKGRRYIRTYVTTTSINGVELSNRKQYWNGDVVWIEVSPLKWYLDRRAKILVSKNLIAAGIRFCDNHKYYGDFKSTEMYTFLNTYFARDIMPSVISKMTLEEEKEFEEQQKEIEKRRNPYRLNFEEVSEEEIIKGAIESGIAVFLHGASSEGKSARVKQIDPDCIIIYLRNATPDSLNGKSVYNSDTHEMIDIKPTWLKKLEDRCEKEPDKLHIVFFDEITNALPSIQGIAFNIILDKEVNGIWKLPSNARIVAAGNDMKDSLAANQLAEPLFNRFAHVYIKTTTEGWLKWASEHNIHPAIYAYIAYKKGKSLRSKYDGEKPNADPRKWEMASKMLYATKNPEMLRALVGEEITREFVEFCNQPVITLDDVIKGNYNDSYIQLLNTASKYATTVGLTQVDEENLEKVRDFVLKLGSEFKAIFDLLWAHGDLERLERLAEINISKEVKKL